MAESVDFKCPHCGKLLRCPTEAVGKTGKCNQCGRSLVVPSPAEPDASLPRGLPLDAPAASRLVGRLWAHKRALGIAGGAIAATGVVVVAIILWNTGDPSIHPVHAERLAALAEKYQDTPESGRSALKKLQVLEARTEVGINKLEFGKALGAAWADVKAFARSPEGKEYGELAAHLVQAVDFYKLSLSSWSTGRMQGWWTCGSREIEAANRLVRLGEGTGTPRALRHLIVPGRGLDACGVGGRATKVTDAFGEPDRKVGDDWKYSRLGLSVRVKDGMVWRLTFRFGDGAIFPGATAEGVGLSSTAVDVRLAHGEPEDGLASDILFNDKPGTYPRTLDYNSRGITYVLVANALTAIRCY